MFEKGVIRNSQWTRNGTLFDADVANALFGQNVLILLSLIYSYD
jgi:hypothetical protein